jgi:hypothetical protein
LEGNSKHTQKDPINLKAHLNWKVGKGREKRKFTKENCMKNVQFPRKQISKIKSIIFSTIKLAMIYTHAYTYVKMGSRPNYMLPMVCWHTHTCTRISFPTEGRRGNGNLWTLSFVTNYDQVFCTCKTFAIARKFLLQEAPYEPCNLKHSYFVTCQTPPSNATPQSFLKTEVSSTLSCSIAVFECAVSNYIINQRQEYRSGIWVIKFQMLYLVEFLFSYCFCPMIANIWLHWLTFLI